MRIIRFDEIDSTNNYAKAQRENGEPLVVTAKVQTGGRGTKGRSFSSNEGGVYLTRLTFYRDFPASSAFRIMADASVAVCRTLEAFGLSPRIKWPNDVYVQDKKICGILIENTFSGDKIANSVVGIGVNVNNALPKEVEGIAVSMREAAGRAFDREKVEETLIEETGKRFAMKEYLERVGYLGRRVTLMIGDERIPAYAVSVDEEGGLLVETEGGKRRVTSAEVSLRLS